FQMRDGVLVFFLVNEKRACRAVAGTLNHAVAAAVGQSLELVQRLVGQRLVACAGGSYGTIAEDAGHLFVAVRAGNGRAMVEGFLGQLEMLESDRVVRLIFR